MNPATKPPASPARLTWECNIRLLREPLLLGSVVKAFAIVYLLMALLMGVIFLGQGEWRVWLDMLWLFALVTGALLVLSVLIMLLIFRNRMDASFILDKRRAFCQLYGRDAQQMAPYARWLGFLLGKPQLGGKFNKLVRQAVEYDWAQISAAHYQAQRYRIVLRNGWRTLLILYCPAPRYAEIAAFVERHIKAAHPPRQPRPASPLPRILWRSVLIVLASASLFALPYPFEQDVFFLIFLLCFGFATAWILSLLGYAVLFGVLWSLGEILYTGFHQRPATFHFSGMPDHYSGFDLLFGDEWLALALTLAGLTYLAWDAWQAVRGRNPSMLERDYGAERRDD